MQKAQPLHPTRAQKINRIILSDYDLMTVMNLKDTPQNVYNMDEKGCDKHNEF